MELELRHLKVIRAIDEAGSLTRAAVGLGLAQPALSAQLKRMERALGGELFLRGRHGVRPTELGELVLERARVLVPAVAELQEEARRFSRCGAGAAGVRPSRFRLGGTHGPLLGGLVDRLADAYPKAQVTTSTSWSTQELALMLADGRIDYVLTGVCGRSRPPEEDRLVWRVLADDPVFVMLGEAHPLAGRAEVELGELAGERWATVPGDGCFGECFAAACLRVGFAPEPVYETDTASCVHLVQVGRAVGLCRATFPPMPGLVTVPLAGTPLMWRHLLGHRPAARDLPAAGRDGPVSGTGRTAEGVVPSADDTAAAVLAHARAVHAEAVAASPSCARWYRAHPDARVP